MITNEKCNNSHAPWHRLKRYSALRHEGPEYEKNINTISIHGEKFYQLHTETTTDVLTCCNLFYDIQHSFYSKWYFETQRVTLKEDLFRNSLAGNQTALVLLDFSKAFDKVCHQNYY